LRRVCWILTLVLTFGMAASAPRRLGPIRHGLSLWPPCGPFRLAALTDSGGGMEAFRLANPASPPDARRACDICIVKEAWPEAIHGL